MESANWFGIWRSAALKDSVVALRQQMSRHIKAGDWQALMALVERSPGFIHAPRLDDAALNTLLHEIALQPVPLHFATRLVALGAWRSLRNAAGERAADLARQRGDRALAHILEPVFVRTVPAESLAAMQARFHEVIRGRIRVLPGADDLWLPPLEPLREMESPKVWFAVPGMYGGFSFWLEGDGDDPRLMSESWCRVVGGSGMRHEVLPSGSRLVDEGFV